MKFCCEMLLAASLVFFFGCDNTETKLVRAAAHEFSKNYCRDYIAVAEIEKTVSSADTCIQKLQASGLWASFGFSQKRYRAYYKDSFRVGNFLPLEVQAEDLNVPGTGQALMPLSLYTGYAYDDFLTSYRDDLDQNILLHKRAVEVFGPLNPKMVNLFSFQRLNDEGTMTVISFTTKKGFPEKTKIRGTGLLYLDGEGRVCAFRMENLEERYSKFTRIKGSGTLPRVTDDVLMVEYAWEKGRVWTKGVEQVVRWVEPENKTAGMYYAAEESPCRNPFKFQIATKQRIMFKDPVNGFPEQMTNMREIFPRENQMGPALPYVSTGTPRTRAFMEKVLAERRAHFQRAGLSEEEEEEEIRVVLNEQTRALDLYKSLYGSQYQFHF